MNKTHKPKVTKVYVFHNLNVAAFDEKCQQIPAIQKNTIRQILKKAFKDYDFEETHIYVQGTANISSDASVKHR